MINQTIKKTRAAILNVLGQRRLRRSIKNLPKSAVPVFFILTPDIVHLAPFCVKNIPQPFTAVLIGNGVAQEDMAWVRGEVNCICCEIVSSLTGNTASLLEHGVVLDQLFAACGRDFCIQDPDCFVTDMAFWESVRLSENDFAAGPFWEQPPGRSHVLPGTFFVYFSRQIQRDLAKRFSISCGYFSELPPKAAAAVKRIGYEKGDFVHSFKGSFDTLHGYWILAFSEGYSFAPLPGEGTQIIHVGGTSYLNNANIEPDYWDYWPLAVQYLNLRLLELPRLERFRDRFKDMTSRYGNSNQLLADYPRFAEGWRRRNVDQILESLK